MTMYLAIWFFMLVALGCGALGLMLRQESRLADDLAWFAPFMLMCAVAVWALDGPFGDQDEYRSYAQHCTGNPVCSVPIK